MISIRRVFLEEADKLTEIALAAKRHWGYPERWISLWTSELTFGPDYFEVNESWAAVMDEEPVAFYTFLDKNGIAWIENLWVGPRLIGKGIGRLLFEHAIDLARQREYKIIQLEADPNARGFYEKMGMHQIGERRSEVDGQPRSLPVMEMEL
jgi:GNAT superfamily N-acetyltransferase